jgi:hypothetical protein
LEHSKGSTKRKVYAMGAYIRKIREVSNK